MSTKNAKTAIIYDKWLDSFGGGEMVAFYMAKFLQETGYQVTIICRKKVSLADIKAKFDINLKNVKFVELWNDENQLKSLTQDKDLFINISFIDYLVGLAKKNIYYAHFPTPIYHGIKGYIFNQVLLPLIANHVKPVEFIDQPINSSTFNGQLMYQLGEHTSLIYSYLNPSKTYNLKFFIFHETISKSSLEAFSFKIKNASIVDQVVSLDHQHNVMRYQIKIKPNQSSLQLNLFTKNNPTSIHLIEPQLYSTPYPSLVGKFLELKLYARVRAGIFSNVLGRLSHYQPILVHSSYVAKWVKKYWHKEATVLYPPVVMLHQLQPINYEQKKNYIYSVGRFFTLGHSKKQDIMIEAFRHLCDNGLTGWELHLAGGLGNEITSISYFNQLQELAKGYPIFFHINRPRQEVLELFYHSKIYWHAAGFGENKNKNPIKFEHFGITPVEAISAGCTPILFNGGGLPEIIEALNLNPKLHLFNTVDQLVRNTQTIIQQNQLITVDTKKLEKYFSVDSFKTKFLEVVNS